MSLSRRDVMRGAAVTGMVASAAQLDAAERIDRIERWGVFEAALPGPDQGNPFDDIKLAATFTCGDRSVTVPGFYDGAGTYRIRFSPPELGVWRWTSSSNVEALEGHRGTFRCVLPAPGNHGPVRVTADGYHFAYADGTPFRQIGTTCYSWALQSDAKCAETLATLKAAPFNKMRMCVFPNVASEWKDPFTPTGAGPAEWDPRRPDPAYFRNFERRILELQALGIEADVILFHPYNKSRRLSDMARADDERYLRYVAARFGAYRNVWWAMGNEYDGIKTKKTADWDHLFQVLVAADPHDRLRSIHQINDYYDHRKPWITHASIQNGSAVLDDGRAQPHRRFAEKAVIFDEVLYEGNSQSRWGQLTGEELLTRFWWGTIAGTYVGHSEAYSKPGGTDGSWLGQGGKLVGTCWPRLAFLRKILESAPNPGIEPIETWYEYHMGGKPFEYYIRYFGDAQPREWPVVIPGRDDDPHNSYRAELIDTWDRTITPVEGVFRMAQRDRYTHHDPARPTIAMPGRKWMAVRLIRA
jgi:hypothetical protein